MQLEAQLSDRNVTFELSDDATNWIVEKGFDRLYGARPMARVIQDHIKKPLADELLFGDLAKGGHVLVKLKDKALDFEIQPLEKPTKKRKNKPKVTEKIG